MAFNNRGRGGYLQGSRNIPARKKESASAAWKCATEGCPAWGHRSKARCSRCGAPRPRDFDQDAQSNDRRVAGLPGSRVGNSTGNRTAADFGCQGPNMGGGQKFVQPGNVPRTGLALPQVNTGLSAVHAPLILPSPTPAAEPTAEGSSTRNQRCEQDAEVVRAAAAGAAAATREAAAAAAAGGAAAAPAKAGMGTLGGNLVRPAASIETKEVADDDAPCAVQNMINSDRSAPAAEQRHPSDATALTESSDAPESAEKDLNMTRGSAEDQKQAPLRAGQESVIPAVNNRSGDTGGGPAMADAEGLLVGGGTGDDERGADDGSGEGGDPAVEGSQEKQQRSIHEGNDNEEVIDGVGTGRPVVGRGGWWTKLLSGAFVVVALVVGGGVLFGGERSSTYRGNVLWQGDVIGVGQHLGSRGIFPWFGSLAVTKGGGLRAVRKIAGLFTYQEVSIAEDIPVEERGGGFLCTAERFARRAMGQKDPEYGLSIADGQLVLGRGRFCRDFTTPVSRGVLDHLGVGKRSGEIRHAHGAFNDGGHFQAISSRGEVLWSTADATGKGSGGSGSGDGGRWRFGFKGKNGAEGPKKTNRGTGLTGGGDEQTGGGGWRKWPWSAVPLG